MKYKLEATNRSKWIGFLSIIIFFISVGTWSYRGLLCSIYCLIISLAQCELITIKNSKENKEEDNDEENS
jgi:hypothetical protein